jgi:NAD(P)-dependent dehydrogenase (short-subunit alcohol dehydrogenase family)
MAENLAGNVAIVTGGGRGIGRAVALGLADAGAAVAIVARSAPELEETAEAIRAAGGRVLPLPADLTDAGAATHIVEETAKQLGPITLLVNNAGTPGPTGDDWAADPAAWWECIEVIVRGAFLCNQAVLPSMIERRNGRIIHMASTTGIRPIPFATATSVAKTALIRLAEGLAIQTAPHDVQVFAIHPGVVRTRLVESYNIEFPADVYVPPEQAARLCVRLASGRYDALSGRFLTVADDLDAVLQRASEVQSDELYTLRLKT